MQNKNTRAIIRSTAPADHKPLIGASGRLYGYIDPKNLVVEFKRSGEDPERIDLKGLLEQPKQDDAG